MSETPFELIGLMTLAKTYNQALNRICKEAQRITHEHDDMGHCGDSVWSHIEHMSAEEAADDLWKKTEDERATTTTS